MIKFTVYGKPIGKQRPRFDRRGGHMYTPKETVIYEKKVEEACLKAMKEGDLLAFAPDEPIFVEMIAYYPIPTSKSNKWQLRAIMGKEYPIVKPDLDNVMKIILDGCQGIAFHDDKQVVDSHPKKAYSNEPRVEVTITTI